MGTDASYTPWVGCCNVGYVISDATQRQIAFEEFAYLFVVNTDRPTSVQQHSKGNINHYTLCTAGLIWSRDSVASVPTGHGLDRRAGVRGPEGSKILYSSLHPNRLWGPRSLLLRGCRRPVWTGNTCYCLHTQNGLSPCVQGIHILVHMYYVPLYISLNPITTSKGKNFEFIYWCPTMLPKPIGQDAGRIPDQVWVLQRKPFAPAGNRKSIAMSSSLAIRHTLKWLLCLL
jgi:hypothetical protein